MLPDEIWCQIFSYLDKKSLQNASLTSKYWHHLIRNHQNLSGYLTIRQNLQANEFQILLGNWPALRTLHLSKKGHDIKMLLDEFKDINFDVCSNLEKIEIDVDLSLEDFRISTDKNSFITAIFINPKSKPIKFDTGTFQILTCISEMTIVKFQSETGEMQ